MPSLTSTTAPGVVFTSREELAAHYQSDWHAYNLKRRQAGLPPVHRPDFEARLAAAQALREEKQAGISHLSKKQQRRMEKMKEKKRMLMKAEEEKVEAVEEPLETDSAPAEELEDDEKTTPRKEELISIDPRQCLFDHHISGTVNACVDRMRRKYGFYVPDAEHVLDLTSLIGYCHEKIKLGHTCLYCQRIFPTWQGCQAHMRDTRHTKLRYEAGVDMEEFYDFYDFAQTDADFRASNRRTEETREEDEAIADNGDEDWEDVSDDEEMQEEEEDDDEWHDFEEQVSNMGFDVNELGELVLPDGRIVGHRSLTRYYKQRAPRTTESTAVAAARLGASERLYRGRVYAIGNGGTQQQREASKTNALMLAKAGIHPNAVSGRTGKGVLVPTASGAYSQVSVYRFRAAMRKQHRGDVKGQRLFNKTNQNINRMDKKHNRLMNGVSVAHAAR